MRSATQLNFYRYLLGGIQAGVALTAVVGGAKLVADPSGGSAAVSLEWLRGALFSDYYIPGLLLLVVIGAGTLVAATATFARFRKAEQLAMASGLWLLIYILVEIWQVGLRTFLQPLYLLLGFLILALGMTQYRWTRASSTGAASYEPSR